MFFAKSVIAAFVGATVVRESIHFEMCNLGTYTVNYYTDGNKAHGSN